MAGAILGRIALDGRAEAAPGFRAGFGRAFAALHPGAWARSDTAFLGASGYGRHDAGLGHGPAQAQPLVAGDLVLLADATLYGRGELAGALGLRAGDQADADLILRAWQRWGPGALGRLNGDFGLVLHDRAAGAVYLARDHIGARPLYWARRGGEVCVATHLAGLRGFDDLDWPLDQGRIARFLCQPDESPTETFLAGVQAVGPGEWLRIDAQGIRRGLWWDPAAVPIRPGGSAPEAAEGLRALTEAAVRDRLPPCSAVGSHLSGGIDSTLVTILAARALRAQGRSLTAAYAWSPPEDAANPDMGPRDERRLIAAQCAELGVPARFAGIGPRWIDALMDRPMELEGTADLVDELPVLAQARTDGLRVMLSGWGGDEGVSTHALGHAAWLLRRGRLGDLLRLVRIWSQGLRNSRRAAGLLWSEALVPLLPGPLYRRAQPFADLYAGGAFPAAGMRAAVAALAPRPELRLLGDADRYMRALLAQGHVGQRMASWAAWGAPQGLTYRYPLTDRRVLEHLLSLPHDLRFGDGQGRALARRAFADVLPRGLRKDDPANERLRSASRMGWWAGLADAAAPGGAAGPCPWLDMAALGAAIRAGPSGDAGADLATVSRIFVAMRVYGVWRRSAEGQIP
jgi:asparagine synthase (glutamine-hydrolysing)